MEDEVDAGERTAAKATAVWVSHDVFRGRTRPETGELYASRRGAPAKLPFAE